VSAAHRAALEISWRLLDANRAASVQDRAMHTETRATPSTGARNRSRRGEAEEERRPATSRGDEPLPKAEVDAMRFTPKLLRGLRLEAAEVRVSEEEILADLMYPARPDAPARPPGGHGSSG
jgi:hypothetical protein